MIGIINLDRNNISRFEYIVKSRKINYVIINDKNDYNPNISKLIIPGIGTFDNTMKYMEEKELDIIIKTHIEQKKPVLGICLGMHILYEVGTEGSECKGLGIFPGKVEKLHGFNIPNIGWHELQICKQSKLLKDITNNDFYFAHSYNVPYSEWITSYILLDGYKIPSTVECNNIYACQFHPEKSGKQGLEILNSFFNI